MFNMIQTCATLHLGNLAILVGLTWTERILLVVNIHPVSNPEQLERR